MQEDFHTVPDGTRIRYAWQRVDDSKINAGGKSPVMPRGTILCLHGRMECLEIYDEFVTEWNHRGFDVVTFDWRGQGGSDRSYEIDSSYRDIFDAYAADLRDFYTRVVKVKARAPISVYGYSMGGCVALDWLASDNEHEVQGLILTSPMLALPVSSVFYGASQAMCQAAVTMGFGNCYLPGQGEFDLADWAFAGNPLTRDPQRFKLFADCFTSRPELATGGVQWGWLDASMRAITETRSKLSSVKVKTLALVGGEDNVVPQNEATLWLQNVPKITIRDLPTARHAIMLETEDIRAAAWQEIDQFFGGAVQA